MFVAWADSGAMPMGHWDGSQTAMWKVAQKYTLADNFFMGGFGGSFFNHQWLICACAPHYADADTSPAKPTIAAVDPDGVTLTRRRQLAEVGAGRHPEVRQRRQPHARLLRGQHDAAALPAERQPAGRGRRSGLCRPGCKPTTLPPQTEPTIGDLLSLKGVSWAWYGGAWQYALDNGNATAGAELPVPPPAVQLLRRTSRPGTAARAEHLRDGGLNGVELHQGDRRRQAAAGRLLQAAGQPQRAFRLCRHRGRRPAHRRRDQPSREEPAVGAHAGRRHLRRERRHLGPRGAAEGRPLGAGHAHPGDHRLAVRQEGLSSTTRPTTRPRSCASSPSASSCRCCAASWCATAAVAANGEPPLGDLTGALDLASQ